MSTLRQALYGIALLGALALLIWAQAQRIEVADKNTELVQQAANAANERAASSLAAITQLKATLLEERKAQMALRTQQDLLRQGLANRQRTIEDLKRENSELQKWSDQLLPDIASSLRQRPAITGAATYNDWLSGRGPVQSAGDAPQP